MKKPHLLFFAISLLFISYKGTAQVQQGDINIGLNGFVQSTTTSVPGSVSSTITNTAIVASGQYYITDNISAGLAPQLTISDSPGFTSVGFGLNIFGNYNFLLSSGKLLPYAGANYQMLNTYSELGTSDSGTFYSSLGVNGGAKYFFTERINFDANLGYTFILASSSTVDGTTLSTDVSGGTLQFTFGIGVILAKRGN